MGDLLPGFDLALWSGRSSKRTSRRRRATISRRWKSMSCPRTSQKLADTCALIYWQGTKEAQVQIEADPEARAAIDVLPDEGAETLPDPP